MEQQHYFPPLHGTVDCGRCEAQNCWCRDLYQRNRRDMSHSSGRCPRLPDLCGFVEKAERKYYKDTFMLVHAELGVGGLSLTVTMPGQKRMRKVYQTKSGYWYCNMTNQDSRSERQALYLEGYQSKEDIILQMKSLRTDYYILRCQMAGYTV